MSRAPMAATAAPANPSPVSATTIDIISPESSRASSPVAERPPIPIAALPKPLSPSSPAERPPIPIAALPKPLSPSSPAERHPIPSAALPKPLSPSSSSSPSPQRSPIRPSPSLLPPQPPPNSVAIKPFPPPTLSFQKLDGSASTHSLHAPETGINTTASFSSKAVSGILRRSRLQLGLRRASLASRIAASILSLISFSVMASDRTKGWAGDSFDRYREYRYCITVNIITFVYSTFQIYTQVHHIMTAKFLVHPPFVYYFDLFFDQMLAYLLISASAAASTRNFDWIVSWGSDPFTVMINGSVSMSYLAFAALAISSLISAHNLFSKVS